jgi:hypothetical protein
MLTAVTYLPVSKLSRFSPLAGEISLKIRETGEGRTPLTVETEVNGDSKSTNERCLSLVGSLGLSCRYKRFLSCLGCSNSRPRTKYFFPHRTLLQSFVPIAQQAGQAVELGRLPFILCVFGENVTWILAVGEGADGYTVL